MSREQRPGMDLRTESVVGEWLGDGPDQLPEHVLQDVLQNTATTPQARRRFLGRWLDRDEGTGRRVAGRDHPPDQNRRTRLMFSATGVIAVFVVAALAVNVVDTDHSPPNVAGDSLVVAADGTGEFATIGAAVKAAADGDTIEILSGRYVEALVIEKDIRLVGEPRGDVVIQAPEPAPTYELRGAPLTQTRHALAIVGADVELSRLIFHGEESRIIADGARVQVTDSLFDGVGVTFQGSIGEMGAIVTLGHTDAVIRGNEFVGGDGPFTAEGTRATIDQNIFVDGSSVAGEFLAGSEIRENVFIGDGTIGISLLGPSGVTIAGNTIRDRSNAIRSYHDLGPLLVGDVRDNIISGASIGINVHMRGDAAIADNAIRDGRIGIQLDGSDVLVSGNEISGQERIGIGVFGGAPVLEGNQLTGNETGLSVAGGATPTLTDNVICENETDVASLDELDLTANASCDG